MEADLRASYETCRRMQRRHDPTYYWATRRLPSEVRPATHALYGYVRTADELVDGPGRPGDPALRRAALDAWEAELERPRHPVALALADAGSRHDLPLGELHPYMDSMRIDCDRVRLSSWEEVASYSDGSAGTVGRIMAVLLDVPENRRGDFGRLGQAFQLTNFLRDVREDRDLDRVYLPVADVHDRDAVRSAVAEGVGRARGLFAGCEAAIAEAPASVRPGVRIAVAIYTRVLDRIEALGFDVLERRNVAPPWAVAGAAVRALRP
jgi:phytoene synthase